MKHYLLSTLLLAGVVLVGCKPEVKRTMPQAGYPTMKVTTSDRETEQQYSARIHSDDFVEIRPQVAGTITKILVDDGDNVEAGQTLFIIDQVPYRAALATAEANTKSAEARVATARLKLQSSEELFSEGVVSEYDMATSRNTLAEAEAALALAQSQQVNAENNLSYTEVRSPFAGVAGTVPYSVGALVSTSITEPLVTIANLDTMFARFALSEADMLAITTNGATEEAIAAIPPVSLLLSDGTTYSEKGKIDAINGSIDRTTGSILMRATFKNPDRRLRDGGVARVGITKFYNNAIVIPAEATFEIQTKRFVYKVVDGKATAAEIISTPLLGGREFIVSSGIKVGDEIVAKGAGLVREGTPVRGAAPAGAPQAKR